MYWLFELLPTKLPHSLWLQAEIEIKFTCVASLVFLIVIHDSYRWRKLKIYFFSSNTLEFI